MRKRRYFLILLGMIVAVLCFFMSLESSPAADTYPATQLDASFRQIQAKLCCIEHTNNGISASYDSGQIRTTTAKD